MRHKECAKPSSKLSIIFFHSFVLKHKGHEYHYQRRKPWNQKAGDIET